MWASICVVTAAMRMYHLNVILHQPIMRASNDSCSHVYSDTCGDISPMQLAWLVNLVHIEWAWISFSHSQNLRV
jgi:hypothetical protein